jgi:hypothetical protein
MKTIILGDTHGTPYWKNILEVEKPDHAVFIGDYLDAYDDNVDVMGNFLEIINYVKSNPNITLLIGNHDYHYFPEVGYTGTSRYSMKLARRLERLFNEYRSLFKMAYKFDNYLCTHAGVSKTFMNTHFGEGNWSTNNVEALLNNLFENNPDAFEFNGTDLYGDDVTQSPIWIRPPSLISDAIPNIKQVVGHTIVENVETYENKIYFIDTMQTSKQYLVIEDENLEVRFLEFENI